MLHKINMGTKRKYGVYTFKPVKFYLAFFIGGVFLKCCLPFSP